MSDYAEGMRRAAEMCLVTRDEALAESGHCSREIAAWMKGQADAILAAIPASAPDDDEANLETPDFIRGWNAAMGAQGFEVIDPAPAPWTPPKGFFRLGGDARLRQCASDGCFQHVSYRMEVGGIGSEYCEHCAKNIAAQIAPLPPTPEAQP